MSRTPPDPVQAAQEKLKQAEAAAALAGDPAVEMLIAIRDGLAAMDQVFRTYRKTVDGHLDEIRAEGEGVRAAAKLAVDEAAAQTHLVHVRQSGEIIDAVRGEASAAFRRMTRAAWMRSAGCVAIALVGCSVAAGTAGWFAGQARGVVIGTAAVSALHGVALHEGPAAVKDWTQLMWWNGDLMAQCRGSAVWVQNGRHACQMRGYISGEGVP